jgi:putative inorganic carbon (HCO3(-)) transporter
LFITAIVLVLAAGTLAFGAVYPWGYVPLLGSLAVIGAWGLLARVGRPANIMLAAGAAVLVLAIGAQLLPLSRPTLMKVSPGADTLLRQYDLSYNAAAVEGRPVAHATSIDSRRTIECLLQVVALGVFFLGVNRRISTAQLRQLIPGLIVLGVVVALVGIVQRPFFKGLIYGFWVPDVGPLPFHPKGGPFGPFINRNHFAGCMLMLIPVAIGYFCAIVTSRESQPREWRARVLWLGSPDGSSALLTAFAILIMSLALAMTLSRSGVLCFITSVALASVVIVRQETGRSRKAIVVIGLGVVALVTLTWAGLDAIVSRFALVDNTLEGRLLAWQDAWRVIRDFPMVGTGLGTYGTATLFYQSFQQDEIHFAEAHNDYLQLLAEGGVLILIPTVLIGMLFAREVRDRFREARTDRTAFWLRIGVVTGIVAMMLQEIVEFSLQMPANAAIFVLLCALAARRSVGMNARQAAGAADLGLA